MIQPHTLPAYFVKEGRVVGAVVDVRGIGNQPMLQRLSTEPSIPYVLEFSLLSGQGNLGGQDPPLPVTVRWGSQTLGDFSNPSTTEWQTFQLNVAAESRVTELSFMTLGTTWQLIDEISVTAVPEPTPVNLAITALAAMAMFRTYTFVISANGRKG
ncbi:MAG TPA: hypothetical protein VM680_01105 [Verrucomicrobiae bacterium]|nr:hypothetical protein [Verrucomicrobiae bacterium]